MLQDVRAFKPVREHQGLIAEQPGGRAIGDHLALIEHEKGELPRDRAKLYEKCLDMLTGRRDPYC